MDGPLLQPPRHCQTTDSPPSCSRQHARLVGRIVRRHACQAHRRYRHDLRCRRQRRRRRRAAHRGASPARPRARPPTNRCKSLKLAAAELKAPLDEMPARIAALLDERKKLERELADARKKLAMGGGAKARRRGIRRAQVGDVKLLARAVSGIELKDLRSLADEGKKQVGSGVVAIVGLSRRRQGRHRGRRHRRSHQALQCGRAGERKAPKCSAAKAAAGGPTWRRPAARTAPRRTPRSRRSKPRLAGA